MRCGISTACFYPGNTLDSLKRVADAGVGLTEVFINTFSELEDGFVARLADVQQASGIRIGSVHPFSSSMEGFFFGTTYPAKVEDGLRLYRRWFEVCKILGADKLVFHGDHEYNVKYFPAGGYAERFAMLAQLGQAQGVTLCQENVAYCRVKTPARAAELRGLLGRHAAFVLDVKQVRRRRGSLPAMVRAMAGAVRLVHVSDYTGAEGCLPPGVGDADLRGLVAALCAGGYTGDFVVELYSDNHTGMPQLLDAMHHVEAIIADVTKI